MKKDKRLKMNALILISYLFTFILSSCAKKEYCYREGNFFYDEVYKEKIICSCKQIYNNDFLSESIREYYVSLNYTPRYKITYYFCTVTEFESKRLIQFWNFGPNQRTNDFMFTKQDSLVTFFEKFDTSSIRTKLLAEGFDRKIVDESISKIAKINKLNPDSW